MSNPVETYCDRFKRWQGSAETFASNQLAHDPELCIRVLENIGSWPSSELELRALQNAYR